MINKLDKLIKKHCSNDVAFSPIEWFAECYEGATPKNDQPKYRNAGIIS